MIKQLLRIGMLLLGACISTEIEARELPTMHELERMSSQMIEGAKVSTSDDAQRLAFNAYAAKMKGAILANEASGAPIIISLGLDVPDFGVVGDKAWEIRFSRLLPDGTRSLRAILWVHAETEKIYYLIGPWNE